MHLGPFGWLTKLGAKRVELVQKFVPGIRVGIFRNERTRSTPLFPKLMFWCFSYYLDSGPFGCLPTLGAKRAELVQKFVARSRVGIFLLRTHPIGPKTNVLVHFVLFGCIWERLVALRNSVQNVPNLCKSSSHEVVSEFFETNAPDPPHWTLNLRFGAFHTI